MSMVTPLLGDNAYDADRFAHWLKRRKIKAVVPSAAPRRTHTRSSRSQRHAQNHLSGLGPAACQWDFNESSGELAPFCLTDKMCTLPSNPQYAGPSISTISIQCIPIAYGQPGRAAFRTWPYCPAETISLWVQTAAYRLLSELASAKPSSRSLSHPSGRGICGSAFAAYREATKYRLGAYNVLYPNGGWRLLVSSSM
jgi:hypothetical protein